MFKYLILSVLLLSLFQGCKVSKPIVVEPKPQWLLQRPIVAGEYYGIATVARSGPLEVYKEKARQNALSDIASQINSKISSVSVLYQVEDKKEIAEILQNRVESKSTEFLEGYVLVGTYSDETTYSECYKLSKELFVQLKEKRKTLALQSALQQYNLATNLETKVGLIQQISAFAKVLELLEPYLTENTSVKSGASEVNLNSESLTKIKNLIESLAITAIQDEIYCPLNGNIPESELSFKVTLNNVAESQVPIEFEITANFLRDDKVLTNEKGIAAAEIQKFQTRKSGETLCAIIDVDMLARLATKSLAVRKLITLSAGKKKCIAIILK